MDTLLSKARALPDLDERLALYAEAQRHIARDQTSVWMYTEDAMIGMDECVKGYEFSAMYPITVLFQDLYMEGCN